MSKRIADQAIKLYKACVDDPKVSRGTVRELHSLIRRRFKDRDTQTKLRSIRRSNTFTVEATPSNTPVKYKQHKPNFQKKRVISQHPHVVGDKPRKVSKQDLSISEIGTLIKEGEDAIIGEFGSVDAFRKYTEDRFEDLDYGKKTAFGSVTNTFVEYVGENFESEILSDEDQEGITSEDEEIINDDDLLFD